MGHVTLTTLTWGDSISYHGQYFTWPTCTQNLKSLALAITEIFWEVLNAKIEHVSLTTLLSMMLCHWHSGTSIYVSI